MQISLGPPDHFHIYVHYTSNQEQEPDIGLDIYAQYLNTITSRSFHHTGFEIDCFLSSISSFYCFLLSSFQQYSTAFVQRQQRRLYPDRPFFSRVFITSNRFCYLFAILPEDLTRGLF
ncbi:hypothetical protein VTL71DRAFT_12171 [Oculimacula yallundae]|uniref:Uncharacterized protein n=1 Tax=Oculimacula yallundae TaxID=86028 RepID=A0ABR4CS46_9HELO